MLLDNATDSRLRLLEQSTNVDERQEESQAQAYHIDLEHVDKVLITDAATTITAAPSAARIRKGVVIRDPKETATPSTIVHSEPKSKDKGKGIMVQEPKPLKKQAHVEQDVAYARELESELNKNINWDDVIEQMYFFKGMIYDAIRPIFEKYFNSDVAFLEKSKEEIKEEASRVVKRKTKSSEEKVAKKKKLDEEVEELKKHL
nr:hypothetical protein [Tanacetum cinerariifolium]